MDTITHALFGAVCAAAVTRPSSPPAKELHLRMAVTGVAAAFPDIDYLGFWIDPLLFLADWHRSATHSLLLMPLWAALLGSCFMLWPRARKQGIAIFVLCCLGILSHIPLDLLTVFGIRILYPLSDTSYSLGITFFIDGYISAILAATLIYFLWRPSQQVALNGLLLLSLYLGSHWLLKTEAQRIAAGAFIGSSDLHVLPQPFSPFYWQLIHRSGDDYQVAYLSLLSEDEALITAYRGARTLDWQQRQLLGPQDELKPLAGEAWADPQFQKFRAFARFPVLYRVDREHGESCVWFTDLRYTLPYLIPAFRYGMCREREGSWRLYRLKRFTERERQPLFTGTSAPD